MRNIDNICLEKLTKAAAALTPGQRVEAAIKFMNLAFPPSDENSGAALEEFCEKNNLLFYFERDSGTSYFVKQCLDNQVAEVLE